MSDDEEVLYKGKDLCEHLISAGYSDFRTFDSQPISSHWLPNSFEDKSNHPNDISLKYAAISHFEYIQLESLLKSKLLFKEDIDFLEPAIESFSVIKTRPDWFWQINTLAAVFSIWDLIKKTTEENKCQKLINHINLLQNLCCNVQKILRFLRETEVLGDKVQSYEVISTLYNPLKTNLDSANHIQKPLPYISQPFLRKCLFISLTDVINILTLMCGVLKQLHLPSLSVEDINCPEETLYLLEENASNIGIPLKELQSLNKKYLSLQSEYIKLICFNICPTLLNISTEMINNVDVYKLWNDIEPKFRDIEFHLKLQYNMNSLFFHTMPSGSAGSKYFSTKGNAVNKLQLEVHNIFLLTLSLLLRVRNVEDNLENIPSNFIDDQSEVIAIIATQLNSLKDDLDSTSKCFNHLYNRVFKQNVSHDNQIQVEKEDRPTTPSSPNLIKKTGIVVGASDFNVNSPDEVFLAISGHNMRDEEPNDDDCYFEKNTQIPVNLLSELSNRLKERKQYFSEREKTALERKGLVDFSDKFCENENTDKNVQTKKPTGQRVLDVSDSSENEDSLIMRVPYKQIYHRQKYRPDVNSESDGSETEPGSNSSDKHSGHVIQINPQSLANLAATRSQLWGHGSEECFSDG